MRTEMYFEDKTKMNIQCDDETLFGFDAENRTDLSAYTCPLCNFILRNPCQLECGHRYCRACVRNQESKIFKCRTCQEETSIDKVTVDRGCENDMRNLKINCFLCKWTGVFQDYSKHLNESHSEIKCEFCGQTFKSANSFTQHELICEKALLTCELEPYGCSDKYRRIDQQNHLLSLNHQHSLLRMLQSKNNRCDDQTLKSIENLAETVKSLDNEAQNIYRTVFQQQTQVDELSKNVSQVEEVIQQTQSYFHAQAANQSAFELQLQSLQETVNELRSASYDGTLLWKIDDFQQKTSAAQSGQQTSIYSPAFYSSTFGYKMRARLFLAGDGSGKRTHLSIFFVLMRGEYDSILEFPFKYKIIFTLFDQTGQRKHIVDSFRPDTKSNSFQRPTSEMNVGSGLPKFAPLSLIQHDNSAYVRDNTMMIRIMVDFNDLSKDVLSHSLQLNPGLPSLVQYESIKRESEKIENKSS